MSLALLCYNSALHLNSYELCWEVATHNLGHLAIQLEDTRKHTCGFLKSTLETPSQIHNTHNTMIRQEAIIHTFHRHLLRVGPITPPFEQSSLMVI